MNTGLAQGLAYRHDFSQAISNYQREDALERSRQAQQMAQTKMFMDGIPEAPAVMGEYDRQNIASKYEALTTEMGEWAKNNQDYATDPAKAIEFKSFKTKIENDPDLLRAISSTENYNQMMAFQAANPNYGRDPIMIKNMEQWNLYSKTGSTDGVNQQGFTFINPAKRLDVETEITNIARAMNTDSFDQDQFGTFKTFSKGRLFNKANALLTDSGPLADALNAQYKDLIANGQLKDISAQQWLANRLLENRGNEYVTTGASSDGTTAEGADASYSEYNEIYKNPMFTTSVENIQAMAEGFYNKETGMINLKDGFIVMPDGFKDDAQFFRGGEGDDAFVHADDQTFIKSAQSVDYPAQFTGRTVKIGNAIESADGVTSQIAAEVIYEIPISQNTVPDRLLVKELVERGLMENNDWNLFGIGEADIDDGSADLTPKSNAIKIANKRDEDGNLVEVLQIQAYVPIRRNQSAQMRVDKNVQGQTVNRSPKDYGMTVNNKQDRIVDQETGIEYIVQERDKNGKVVKAIPVR